MAPSIVKAPAGKTRRMTEHAPDPGEQIEREADQLEEELDRLEGHLDEAKDRLKERREDAVGPGEAEEAAGDWSGQAPDRPLGDDPEGG
jgi:predicted nuclease with TOPRIM domain